MDYYMSKMSITQIRRFVNQGTFTGKLATVNFSFPYSLAILFNIS